MRLRAGPRSSVRVTSTVQRFHGVVQRRVVGTPGKTPAGASGALRPVPAGLNANNGGDCALGPAANLFPALRWELILQQFLATFVVIRTYEGRMAHDPLKTPWVQCGLAVLLFMAGASLAVASKPLVPNLTKGAKADGKHDWNLGPTGARGWIWGWKLETTDSRQILITSVAPGSPAHGVLQRDDVILGVGGKPFSRDARRSFGEAITEAETTAAAGRLVLLRW